KCSLTLGVTAGDLRAGQGYVRCGRCSSVFNALTNLHDDVREPADRKDEPAPRDDSATAENPVLLLEESLDEELVPDSALEFDPRRSDATSVFVQEPDEEDAQLRSGSFETIVLEGDSGLSADEDDEPFAESIDPRVPASLHAVDSDSDAESPPLTDDDELALTAPEDREFTSVSPAADIAARQDTAQRAAAEPATAARDHDAGEQSTPAAERLARVAQRQSAPAPPIVVSTVAPGTETFVQALEANEHVSEKEQRMQRVFSGGSVLLAALLLIQLLHHFRDELAAQPALHAVITGVYAAIGMPLLAHWDVDAYEVRQLGASAASAPGRLLVGASLKNGAARAQPCPILRVTLQDRYGNRLAARDFDPREYLDRLPQGGMLAGGQRIDTELALVDPGQNAVGFELDACLRSPGGALHCASQTRDR
ncbi:MAG TPA: DUF3426 domain-containing protein, partial [Steroidobacteraceae bacterium]